MTADIFLKLGDIKGESIDEQHRDEIELLSWSWGLSQAPAPAPTGTGQRGGKVAFQEFNFEHNLDKASPRLMQACATGQHIADATISERKPGPSTQDFLIIRFSDVIVTSVQQSGDGEGVTETVRLQAAKVDLEYKPQRPDGSLDASIHFKFDILANRPL